MTTLYTTRATVVGGRDGHARSEDGLLDVQLSMPKACLLYTSPSPRD